MRSGPKAADGSGRNRCDTWDEGGGRPAAASGLHDRLARLEAAGVPATELSAIRADIEALEARVAKGGAA